MKAGYGVLIGLAVAFGIFSTVFGIKATKQRSSYRPSARAGSRDDGYDRFVRERSKLHNIVRGVSIPFFLGCLGTFVSGAIFATGRKGWRITAIVGSVLAGAMIMFSLILSGGASFDELFVVWIASSVVFAGLAVFGLISELGRNRGVQRPSIID